MKKKHRDITVNGKQYAWMVKKVSYGNKLKIWDEDKKVIHENVYGIYQRDQRKFTPGLISRFIQRYDKVN